MGLFLKCGSFYSFNWLFSFSNLMKAHSDPSRVKSFMTGKSKGQEPEAAARVCAIRK